MDDGTRQSRGQLDYQRISGRLNDAGLTINVGQLAATNGAIVQPLSSQMSPNASAKGFDHYLGHRARSFETRNYRSARDREERG